MKISKSESYMAMQVGNLRFVYQGALRFEEKDGIVSIVHVPPRKLTIADWIGILVALSCFANVCVIFFAY